MLAVNTIESIRSVTEIFLPPSLPAVGYVSLAGDWVGQRQPIEIEELRTK